MRCPTRASRICGERGSAAVRRRVPRGAARGRRSVRRGCPARCGAFSTRAWATSATWHVRCWVPRRHRPVLRPRHGATGEWAKRRGNRRRARGARCAGRRPGSSGPEPVYDFSHQKLRALVYEQTGLARAACSTGGWRPRCPDGGRARRTRPSSPRTCAWPATTRARRSATASPRSMRPRCTHTPTRSSISRRRLPWVTATSAVARAHGRPAHPERRLRRCAGELRNRRGPVRAAALATIEHKLGDVHQRRGEWELAEARFLAALDAAPEEERPSGAHPGRPRPHVASRRPGRARDELAREALDARRDRGRSARPGPGAQHARRAGQERRRTASAALVDSNAASPWRKCWATNGTAAALNNLALVKRDAGELPEALTLTESALALCAAYGDRHREAALENNLADLHHAAGDEDDAMATSSERSRSSARWAQTRPPAYPRSGSSSAGEVAYMPAASRACERSRKSSCRITKPRRNVKS